MPLNIRSETVNQLAEQLAAKKRINKTEAVRLALENELRRTDEKLPFRERLRPLQEKIASYRDSDVVLDKKFFDDLSGEY
ncbi:type II toxin-antitoxin system VapB family antitoxin (plasmid) [Rhizobium sullae]|uniref:Transcription factor n=1 Tax=Rhizobium sullae TaxID=50338 RepID=A0A2N0DB92_RHISU|nr:type II toxin-antitoxin system VapB family antitoxin [Rhizobium sullae]PKA43370.1 transcription factor [Rhizobium sullae]UWU18797.1 type II toxin-antitoxin system VapB family antitoxin [Rhizobium sullae]